MRVMLMKTNKTKTLTKMISCFLCTAITLQVGLTLTGEKVNAAGFIGLSSVGNGNIVELGTEGGYSPTSNFYIRNKYTIVNESPASDAITSQNLNDITELRPSGWANVYIETNLGTNLNFYSTNAKK